MISDQARLWLLLLCVLGCLGTIFTSNSFHVGGDGIPKVTPSPQRYCKKAREAAKRCLSSKRRHRNAARRSRRRIRQLDSNRSEQSGGGGAVSGSARATATSCTKLLDQVSRCEQSVFKAYAQINMGGCIREIQTRTICEIEWCEDVPITPQSMKLCEDECKEVRESLSKCERRIVETYFHRIGLLADGTLS